MGFRLRLSHGTIRVSLQRSSNSQLPKRGVYPSLRRVVPNSYSIALAWGELVGLSPFVKGRVNVSRGYNPCFGRVEAPNAPPVVCLSFGQDLDGDFTFYLSR